MATQGIRYVRKCIAVALAGAVAMVLGSCAGVNKWPAAEYCAIMPDSTGLYAGNPVTQMGYQIGAVKAITPMSTAVRVDFSVTANRPLSRDVKAIIRSTSVLADRALELVGDADGGPQLAHGECVPLSRSFTPKSLSAVIGSATDLINSVSPDGSTNIADIVRGVDQAIHNNGSRISQFLTTTSGVLDSPDETVAEIGSSIRNVAQLTSLIRELRGPLKQILQDAHTTTPDVVATLDAGVPAMGTPPTLVQAGSDIEENLGMEIQFTLDTTSVAVRKAGAHAPAIADLLTPVPWWINTIANHYNNRPWNLLQYRPPMYRIRTPNGVALCNIMNASVPGSCANVQGQPYAADVALLQYVLTQAQAHP